MTLCLCATLISTAQTQQGIVKTPGRLASNGKVIAGKRIAGATVQVKGRNTAKTGTDGIFSFPIPANVFFLESVKKNDYVLVDPDATSRRYSYTINPLILLMERTDQQADYILANEKLEPIVRPSFDVTKLSEEELEVKVTIVTRPNVNLGKYQGYELGKKNAEVKDEEVEQAINELRKQNATVMPKEGQAEKGDIVVIDFEGSIDGVPFDGGKAENHELELGSHSFIEGFEDQLIGSSAGIEVDVKVTFPKNYGPDEIAGKDAVFHVKVNEVKQKVLPELDEEFIKDLNIANVTNVDELRKDRQAALLKQKEARKTYKIDSLNKVLI